MDDFIVKDDLVEQDYAPKDKKQKKKRRAPEIKPLDEEDLEVIRENVGIDLKRKVDSRGQPLSKTLQMAKIQSSRSTP